MGHLGGPVLKGAPRDGDPPWVGPREKTLTAGRPRRRMPRLKKTRRRKDLEDRDGGAHQPHDALFLETFSEKAFCAELLSLILTQEEAALFDWATLRIDPGSFVTERGRRRCADLVLEIWGKGGGGDRARIVFLTEHKSYKDAPGTLAQLFEYLARFHFEEKGPWRTPVVPIVFYHGREDWSGPLRWRSLLKGAGPAILEAFEDCLLDFGCRIVNLRKLDVPREARGLTCKPILYIMQKIWDLDDERLSAFSGMVEEVGDEATKKKFLLAAAWYVKACRDDYSEERIMSVMKGALKKPELLPSFITDAREEGIGIGVERGIEQGLERGREEERKRTAKTLLRKGVDRGVVLEATGLTEAELGELETR